MRATDLRFLPVFAFLASGCDKTEATEAKADAKYTVKAENLDLAAVVKVVERADVRDAESVEAVLNAEDSPIQLDVDEDGKRDFISVREVADARTAPGNMDAKLESGSKIDVEVQDGATARFELVVVPSSTSTVDDVEVVVAPEANADAVVVATLDFKVDVKSEAVVVEAAYAPVVVVAEGSEHVYVHEIHIDDHHDDHIIVAAPFVAWVWLGARPVYVGHHHLPPGHLDMHWHGDIHVDGDVHVESVHIHEDHGHHDSVQIKVKSKGGPSGGKTQVKVKSKGGGGGKGKFK